MIAGDLGLGPYLHDDDVMKWLRLIHGRLVEPGTDVPRIGSAAWLDAPEPVKLAGVLRAARSYYVDEVHLARRVEDELRATRDAQDVVELDAWQEAVSRVVEIASGPSHQELQRLRGAA